jgi:hypothetical protein
MEGERSATMARALLADLALAGDVSQEAHLLASAVSNPSSPQALAISNLFILVLVVIATVFALITGLVIYSRCPRSGETGWDHGLCALRLRGEAGSALSF